MNPTPPKYKQTRNQFIHWNDLYGIWPEIEFDQSEINLTHQYAASPTIETEINVRAFELSEIR